MARKSTTVLRTHALKISDMLDTIAAYPETPEAVRAGLESALSALDAQIILTEDEDEQ